MDCAWDNSQYTVKWCIARPAKRTVSKSAKHSYIHPRFTENRSMAVLNEAKMWTPVLERCRIHGIGSATCYKRRPKLGSMNASLTGSTTELAGETWCREKLNVDAELSAALSRKARDKKPNARRGSGTQCNRRARPSGALTASPVVR